MKIKERINKWFNNLFKKKPKVNTPGDFLTVSRNGSVSMDIARWGTPEGKAELDKLCREWEEFEKKCRARDPEGKFTFYD